MDLELRNLFTPIELVGKPEKLTEVHNIRVPNTFQGNATGYSSIVTVVIEQIRIRTRIQTKISRSREMINLRIQLGI